MAAQHHQIRRICRREAIWAKILRNSLALTNNYLRMTQHALEGGDLLRCTYLLDTAARDLRRIRRFTRNLSCAAHRAELEEKLTELEAVAGYLECASRMKRARLERPMKCNSPVAFRLSICNHMVAYEHRPH